VEDILGQPSDLIDCTVGHGNMGSLLCHENEAPFPERLAEFLILTFSAPGMLCIDPFAGSGTTVAVAVREGRRGLGGDLRASQVELARKRISLETPTMFPVGAEA
jgi:DNA modification methylase